MRWFIRHIIQAVLIVALICNVSSVYSQVDSLSRQFERYQEANLPEKVFVHTDKDFYVSGELMWFKVYCVDGFYHKPLDISKLVYVELIAAGKKPVAQAKIEMKDGSGNGSFVLPASLASGNYLFRAYTRRMRNYPAEYYFEKVVSIVNTAKSAGSSPLPVNAAWDIQFMPEGGNLVAGVDARVGLKIVDESGKGRESRGVLVDDGGDTVARFQTLRFGMGSFEFRPDANKNYKALFATNDGRWVQANFPTVYQSGYSMQLDQSDQQATRLAIRTNGVKDSYVSLLIHTRGVLKVADKVMLNDGRATINIEPGRLGDGVSVITLFNSAGMPVCERLFFKRPSNIYNLAVRADKAVYGTRSKVTTEISLLDKKGGFPDLSFSAFLLDSLQPRLADDIVSYFWLRSDLAGYIENAGYYLSQDPGATQALDNLLLTQGWRRFNWQDIAKKNTNEWSYTTEYSGPIIEGKFTSNGQPASGIETWLSVPGQHFYLASDSSKKDGRALYQVPSFYGSNEIIVQSNSEANGARFFELTNPFSDNYSVSKMPALNLDEKWRDMLNRRSVSSQVQLSFSDSVYQDFRLPASADTIPFYGKPDKEYLLDDYTRFVTMEEVLREYVAEVRLRKQGDQYRISVKNAPYLSYFDNQPLVLIDGVPVKDMNKVLAIDPLKIRKLDVVARKFYLGTKVEDGILSYSSYEGDLGGYTLGQNSIVIDYEGLQMQRQFYSPVYETPAQLSSRLPDFRNLLFWEPNVKAGLNGSGKVEFYTSDVQGTYAILVQGISKDGRPMSTIQFINVSK